jgi:hypothetical protein
MVAFRNFAKAPKNKKIKSWQLTVGIKTISVSSYPSPLFVVAACIDNVGSAFGCQALFKKF